MYRFWEAVMEPCFKLNNVKTIVEVGAQNGYNTKKLAAYAQLSGGKAYSIDPYPMFDYQQMEKDGSFKMLVGLSLDMLPQISDYDAVLLDGDHNWYTVYNELKLIREKNPDKMPIVFLHDIAWSYARRDLYYNPDNIPKEFRQPYKKCGIKYGEDNLCDNGGINGHLCNAIDVNTPKNGVLTAVDDFIAENKDLKLKLFNCICGLGVIYNKEDKKIAEFLNDVGTLHKVIEKTEEQRIFEFCKKNEFAEKIRHQSKVIEELRNKIKEVNNENCSITEKVKKSDNEIRSLKEKNRELRREVDKSINSIRYRIGTAIVDSRKSVKDFVKTPVRLARLFKQGRTKGNDNQTSAKTVVQPESFKYPQPVPATIEHINYSKADVISYNANKLNKINTNINGKPLVSIIIINRNGLVNLKTLFESLTRCNYYDNFEIVVVDNHSSDKSIAFLENLRDIKVKIIANKHNESFSEANNKGAKEAKGEFLLFLNNDIEVTDKWLDVMLSVAQRKDKCGAVGAKLVYPEVPSTSINKGKSFTVQHKGISFIDSSTPSNEYFIRPVNMGNGTSAIRDEDEIIERSCVTAACLLVSKSAFEKVGGYDEQYVYGYEDVDLCLKLVRAGYHNYYCSSALLFHYEFGTQSKSSSTSLTQRRLDNINIFKNRWQSFLVDRILEDKANGTKLFTDKPMTVAFCVTDDDPKTTAGDYFTAMEFGTSLEKLGWKIKYLAQKKGDERYNVGWETDIVVSLLENYDVTKMKNFYPRLKTVAWARNWFDRWCAKPYINDYDMIFASSITAVKFMEQELERKVKLFPIATNAQRFVDVNNLICDNNSKYESDYVFTGSYWNDPREIIDILCPDELQYKFKIFGANWDKIDKFSKSNGGFVNYNEMPLVYKNTKIVVDDANRVTKPYGAVNSRVFDALAAGRLVITNGKIGADETFEGMLPCFSNKEEFNALVNLYMSDKSLYDKKVAELKSFVLNKHTYDIRAKEFKDIIKSVCVADEKKIAIMLPVLKWEEKNNWGDYHFGVALKKCFENEGYSVELRILPEWNREFDGKYVLVLRGISKYTPNFRNVNIMWNISHPDDISNNEYNEFDAVFVSSQKYAYSLKNEVKTFVAPLMQCTDSDVFGVPVGDGDASEILFVGNSRMVKRKIIMDVIPPKYELSVYGSNWENLIDSKYIKGTSIDNSELVRYYHNSKILLNDHWDDMREHGYVSNRLFDGLAAGAFIISDYMPEIDEVFGGSVVTYKDKKDLKDKIDYYMNNPEERAKLVEKGRKLVLDNHTFKNRTDTIIEFMRG